MRLAKSLEDKLEILSYLDKMPMDRLIIEPDLAAQCFIYHLVNFNLERCRMLYEKFETIYRDQDIFRALRFAEVFVTREEGLLPELHTLSVEEIDALPFGKLVKAFVLAGNSITYLAKAEYASAEQCVDTAIRNNVGSNMLVDFYAFDQKAQILEETGRLNDSLACYAKAKKSLPPLLSLGANINYYFGITGVYMLRMELEKAAESLEQAERGMADGNIQSGLANITLAFHKAEMDILGGSPRAAEATVEEMLARYPGANMLSLVRLIHELNCEGVLSAELASGFLRDFQGAGGYKTQPFARLARARILFDRGQKEEACSETDGVMTFARANRNQLRLVEAGLLKAYYLGHGIVNTGVKREINNLLLEAVYYAHKDRILLPFYLGRRELLPYFQNLQGQKEEGSEEAEFIKDACALCRGRSAVDSSLLTSRELGVLKELAKGYTNKRIGEALYISQATVKTHVLSIFNKLGVSSRMMAVAAGRKRGLVE